MSPARTISLARASLVARSHACPRCGEYSFKKIVVKKAPTSHRRELKTAWTVDRVCGVCGLEQELGIDNAGEIVYG